MASQSGPSFDFAVGQDAIGLQQPLEGAGINDTSRSADQYLDNSVVNNMTEFDPEEHCNSGDLKRVVVESHRHGDNHMTDDLSRSNYFGEAGTFDSNGLDSSLLNRDFKESFDYFPSASESSQINNGHNHGTPPLNDRHWGQYQQGIVIAPSSRQFASNLAINTPTSSRPQHSRRFSHLRNEYIPSTEPEPSMADPQSHQVYTSSPSRYTLRPQPGSQPGPTPPQVLQPFQESNLRLSVQQLPGYNTVNQMAQHQQLTYSDPQRYSQYPFSLSSCAGLPYQPVPQHTSVTPQLREFAMRPPSTPPNLYEPFVGSSEGNLSFDDSSPDSIKHEGSSACSPSIPAKRVIRKVRTRMVTKSSGVVDVDSVSYSESDEKYIEELMDAMTDMSQAEDNVGMKATWNKILVKKADKIRPMCVEMLGLLKRAVNEQLGDKKSANSYPDFEQRFREFCDAARTQKTIGKHLMEAPYSHTVANDPTYAASRVRNNRRVNGQKRTAITLGRRAMGLAKGKGKGHRLRKLDGSPADSIEEGLEDAVDIGVDNSGDSEDDDIFAMEEYSNGPMVKSEPPSVRKSTRNSTRKTNANEVDESPVPKKKKKRGSPSKYQITDEDHMIDMAQPTQSDSVDRDMDNSQMAHLPRPLSRAHHEYVPSSSPKCLPTMGSSPYQPLEPAQFHHNSHVFGYHPYGPNAPSLPRLHLDHNGGFYSQNVLPFNQPTQQYTGYSSGTDQGLLEQANNEQNANGVTFGAGHRKFHHS